MATTFTPKVTADYSKLEQDCSDAARHYLIDAVERIDAELGEGYAASRPGVIAAYIRAAATESLAIMVKLAGQDIAEALEEHIAPALASLVKEDN